MNKQKETPGLLEDLGAIAGLYKTVFSMMGKRIQYGQDWEERLSEEALRVDTLESRERHEAASRQHVHN
jgi:hypothetical protein